MPKNLLQVVGYSPTRHVAPEPQWIAPGTPLTIGWDTAPASHVHAAVICQRNGPQIRVFATFAVANDTLKQLIDEKILPFLLARARWALGPSNAREYFVHVLDPAALTWEGYSDLTADFCIRQALGGGRIRAGAPHWTPRITPLLTLLSPNSEVTLKFDPGPTCDLGRRACAGLWHYTMTRGGSVKRDAPAKDDGSLPTSATRSAMPPAKCNLRDGRSSVLARRRPRPASTRASFNEAGADVR